MILNIRQREGIKRWLRHRPDVRAYTCPFGLPMSGDGDICKEWFPKIKKEEQASRSLCGIPFKCPCGIYNKDYVAAKAGRLLNESK